MTRKAKWAELDAGHLGFMVICALSNLERGEEGEVIVEMSVNKDNVGPLRLMELPGSMKQPDSRWIKIVGDRTSMRIVIFEIEAPQKGQAND